MIQLAMINALIHISKSAVGAQKRKKKKIGKIQKLYKGDKNQAGP